MGEPQGVLIIPIGYNPSDEQRAITVDINDYLHTVLATGLTGGGMGEPRGKIAVACGYNPDGKLRTIELDADDNLLITLLGGAANQILSSDGTKFGAATIADVLEAAILTADGDILIRSGGVVQALPKEDDDDVLTLDSGIPAWKVGAGGGGDVVMIEDQHLSASTAAFSFTSIAATYKHLLLKGIVRSDRSANTATIGMQYNNDTGNNYDCLQFLFFHTNTDLSDQRTGVPVLRIADICAASATANKFSPLSIFIPDYADTAIHKTHLSHCFTIYGTASGNLRLWYSSGAWRNASAINRVDVMHPGGFNFVAGSRMTLYGMN